MKLKFQIRDLLWLMVVVACCALWWRERVLHHALLTRLKSEQEVQLAQTRAMMEFLNQSLSAVPTPPTPPANAVVAPPERENRMLDSEGAAIEPGDSLVPNPRPNSAGEDGAFSPPENDPLSLLSPHRIRLVDGAFWLLFGCSISKAPTPNFASISGNPSDDGTFQKHNAAIHKQQNRDMRIS